MARALHLDPDTDGAKKGRNTYFKKVMKNMEQFTKIGQGTFALRAFGENDNPDQAAAATGSPASRQDDAVQLEGS